MALNRPKMAPKRPLDSATNRVEETRTKSGAIAWEVRKKSTNGKSEEGKRQAKNSDFAWEVLQKSENERF